MCAPPFLSSAGAGERRMVSSTVAHGEFAAVAAVGDLLATSDRTSAHRSGDCPSDLHGSLHACHRCLHHPQQQLQLKLSL